MNSDKQREIARKGGMAAHRKGTAHEFTTEEARSAGKKGGERVSANRAHMVEIGRLGGKRSAERRRTSGRGGQSGGGHAGDPDQGSHIHAGTTSEPREERGAERSESMENGDENRGSDLHAHVVGSGVGENSENEV